MSLKKQSPPNMRGFVPGAGLFYEPFIRDLELIWSVGSKINKSNIGK
jgi:hypothetical protein